MPQNEAFILGKNLQKHEIKEHVHWEPWGHTRVKNNIFCSAPNSTPLALIDKEGEIFLSKWNGDFPLSEKHWGGKKLPSLALCHHTVAYQTWKAAIKGCNSHSSIMCDSSSDTLHVPMHKETSSLQIVLFFPQFLCFSYLQSLVKKNCSAVDNCFLLTMLSHLSTHKRAYEHKLTAF